MSNGFTNVRTALKNALNSPALQAFTAVPEVVTAPAAWVAPGDPYVTREGATFGGEIVRCQVVLLCDVGTNEVAAEALDELIGDVLDILSALDDFYDVTVGQPGTLTVNGQSHLGVAIEVQTEIHRS